MQSSIASGLRTPAALAAGVLTLVAAFGWNLQSAHAQPAKSTSATTLGAPAAPPAHAATASSALDPALGAISAARQASAAGDHVRALEILEGALRGNDRDARLRFAHAVALSQAGRTDAALAAFTALTEEFPELPEPHNNVATLYAARGELELARTHLEMALRARPDYALAHENLGDLYLRLAERAYQRAGQAAPADAGLRTKRALAREWIERITAPR